MDQIDKLIYQFTKIPGFGKRSARRAVLHLMQNEANLMRSLARDLALTAEQIITCESCGNISLHNPCNICTDPKRDSKILCIVEDVGDLWVFERAKSFRGLYHVLGGTLSAIDGRTPEKLNIETLFPRISDLNLSEIIIATNATLDGQTTAIYIADSLKNFSQIKVTRLAHGIPLGGELDYVDDGTLEAALLARSLFG